MCSDGIPYLKTISRLTSQLEVLQLANNGYFRVITNQDSEEIITVTAFTSEGTQTYSLSIVIEDETPPEYFGELSQDLAELSFNI